MLSSLFSLLIQLRLFLAMLLARRAFVRLGAATRRLQCSSVTRAAALEQPTRRQLPPTTHRPTAPLPPTTLHPRRRPLSSTTSTASVVAAAATKQPSFSSGGNEEEEGSFGDDDEDFDELDPGDEDDEETPADEEVDDGGTPWGQAALAVARGVLSADDGDDGDGSEQQQQLSLWSFKAHPSSKRVEIRLDKPSDRYGSPSLDDVSAFSRRFAAGLAAALGEEAAGELEVEASSAGAARRLRLPRDLERFAEMPLAVSPRPGSAAAAAIPKPHPAPLRVVGVEEGSEGGEGGGGTVTFATADVRATRGNRGRLTKKQLEARFEVLVSELEKVTLYVDV